AGEPDRDPQGLGSVHSPVPDRLLSRSRGRGARQAERQRLTGRGGAERSQNEFRSGRQYQYPEGLGGVSGTIQERPLSRPCPAATHGTDQRRSGRRFGGGRHRRHREGKRRTWIAAIAVMKLDAIAVGLRPRSDFWFQRALIDAM